MNLGDAMANQMMTGHCGGCGADYFPPERVVKYQAERVSGVAWPVCQDWIRDRM